jgi:lysophospholipase L1-like esterase
MKKWLYLSILGNVILIVLLISFIERLGGLHYLINKLEIPYTAEYQNRTSQFNMLNDVEGEIFFVGNSITEQGNWNELFNSKCLNRGIAGDDSKGILNRLKEITDKKPAKIFIMVGINDLGRGESIENIIKNYREILKKIREDSPTTKVYVQSVLPVNNTLKNQHRKNNDIILLNDQIRSLSSELGLTFINLFPLFTNKSGEMDLKLSGDGIHINGSGYLIWKNAIVQYVNE